MPVGSGLLGFEARPTNSLAPRLAAVIFPASSKRRSGSLRQSRSACGQAASSDSSSFRLLRRSADAAMTARNSRRSNVERETALPGSPTTSVPRSCPSDSSGNATILVTGPCARPICGARPIARRAIGRAPQMGRAQGPVTRIVAFPLESEGQLLGTLVVGLPGSAVSLSTFDRLELRAVMAASALRRRRRKEEESLLAAWPHALLDCLSEPLLLLDEAGKITAASRGARELVGLASKPKRPEPTGIPTHTYFAELFCGRDREHLRTWMRGARDRGAKRGGTDNEFSRAELHNGVAVQLRLAVPVEGQPTVILLKPLVSRKSAGPADHAEIELQNVIEWLEEGVILFDAQDNIRAMNTRFEQFAGFAPEESGKIKTLEGLIGRLRGHAAEPALFTERWRELARGIEGGVRQELQMMHPSPRILERAARPVLDPVGRLLGRVEIYRDLTAQRVFHSKLLQTEKLAALGQMVSGVAHELSNPLTSIQGYAHRPLARQDLPGRTEELRQ